MKHFSTQWTPLHREMVYSTAFQDLNVTARKVLDFALLERVMEQVSSKKSKKKRYICSNKDEIHIPYRQLNASPFNMNDSSISRGIKSLLAHGFITIKEQGGSRQGHSSIYSLSDKWRGWKHGDILEERESFSKRGRTNKSTLAN